MPSVLRILFVDPSARDMQLAAEVLHQTTDCLPGMYVFDVVTTNFGALERVSRTSYRLVCVAEDASSGLDGRSAANILRQSCPGITVILILDDDDCRRKHGSATLKRGAVGSSPAARLAVSPRDTPGRRSTSPDNGIFRNVRIVRGSSNERMSVDDGVEGGAGGSETCGGGSSVDLSVVDYVLKKPFSDESFRRLLEAVEADHLQVPLLLKGMSADGTAADEPRVTAAAGDTLSSPSGRGTGVEKGDGKGGDETATAAERGSSAGCNSSEAFSYIDHRSPHRPPNPDAPWLPLKDRVEDIDKPQPPEYTPPWLPPPEPALLPPPQPLAPRDPSEIKPSVQWRQQVHAAPPPQAPTPAVPSESAGVGGAPPIALGSMMYPAPRVGVAMHIPSWTQAPGVWYPHPAIAAAAAAGPSPQHHYLHQSLYRHDYYPHHNHHQHPFTSQTTAGHLYSGVGPGVGGVRHAPLSDGATTVAGAVGSGIGVAANGGGVLSAPAAAAAASNATATNTAENTAANTAAGGAERANQWPPPMAQPRGGSTTTVKAPARRAGKRARVHAPPGAAAALIKGLLSMPVTKSSARWTEEAVHGRSLRVSEEVVPLARGSPSPAFSAKPGNGLATATVASSNGGAAAAATAMVAAAEAAAVPTGGGMQTSTSGDPKANFRPAVWALGFDSEQVVAEPQPSLLGSDHKRGDINGALSPAPCHVGTMPQQWRGTSITDTSELLASLLVENDTSRKASALGDAAMRSLSIPPSFPAV